MKILLLADPSSTHTIKWANSLFDKGLDVFLFGLSGYDLSLYHPGIKIESFNIPLSIKDKFAGNILKSVYLIKLGALKKRIKSFKPDILHSHYVSSYGFLGALSGFHPFVSSVWGTDIYIFPNVSFLHKKELKYSLSKADFICSTSHALANETVSFINKEIRVVPFGVDLNEFKPTSTRLNSEGKDIVIGTVKRLEKESGIDNLMKAFSILVNTNADLSLKLLIVGGGSMERWLKNYAVELEIEALTIFTRMIAHNKVPEYHNMMDIEVYLSNYESFGVSVVEASACENPVVVSNVGGLPEVVDDNVTGFIIPAKDPQNAADALRRLTSNKELRIKFGKAGRERVKRLFNWNNNVDEMIRLYDGVFNMNKE
jgi:glycosyltransferase involved in cell wall biosynthesis